ncbi:sensor histidine kinase [Pedobacter nototheniae]|uniref:sensor histidine kinase n=1 Tax=Pedobacter nototheniae TaxID=2488994 RepID=UPI00103D0B70|nr:MULTISPECIES: sensor histidine kinase [Pedobacter]
MSFFNLSNFYKKYKIHLIVWSVYIIYEVIIAGLINNIFGQVGSYVLFYLVNICLFYSHAYLFNILLKNNKLSFKIIGIPVLIFAEIAVYTILVYLLQLLFIKLNFIHRDDFPVIDKDYVARCIFRSLLFIGFSTGYVYILKSFEDRKKVEALERQSLVTQIEKQSLENDLVNSQNNYLRSQINPHFLFNTLNFIYNDARKKAPLAADAIMNLAEMMRYALKRPEASEMVPLSEEVEQIEHLINLHRLRTGNTINLELEVTGDLFGIRFPPLILLTLIENIFKHGNVSHSTQPAQIKINYENSHLSIKTINMINDVKSKASDSHHVGVENIGKRLHNFYKESCEFKFYQDPLNRYITEINVDIINPLAKLNATV